MDPGAKVLLFITGGGGVLLILWWLFHRLTGEHRPEPNGEGSAETWEAEPGGPGDPD